MSRAIALMDLLGLRRILALTALIIFGVREDRGLPLRGRSSVLEVHIPAQENDYPIT